MGKLLEPTKESGRGVTKKGEKTRGRWLGREENQGENPAAKFTAPDREASCGKFLRKKE